MSTYENRQGFELDNWPDLRQMVNDMAKLVFSERTITKEYKQLVFTMASLASGCTHCQSHGAFSLKRMGVETERIQAIWQYETSELFTDAERAGLDLVRAAAQSPNAVGPEHFVELRKHYTDEQIIEIMGVNSFAGWLNRWNDTIATVTDQESVDWALENLTESVGPEASTSAKPTSSAMVTQQALAGQRTNLLMTALWFGPVSTSLCR